mmetsp:Transcript_119086/g.336831  ORF Transcript_119086/g.336831 Transcript_119086/m.336831 type:complete len:257 (+) Transcript_119086:2262-3032(+)
MTSNAPLVPAALVKAAAMSAPCPKWVNGTSYFSSDCVVEPAFVVPTNISMETLIGGSSVFTWRSVAMSSATATNNVGNKSCEAQAFRSRRTERPRFRTSAPNCCSQSLEPLFIVTCPRLQFAASAKCTCPCCSACFVADFGTFCTFSKFVVVGSTGGTPDMQCGDCGAGSSTSVEATVEATASAETTLACDSLLLALRASTSGVDGLDEDAFDPLKRSSATISSPPVTSLARVLVFSLLPSSLMDDSRSCACPLRI